LYAFCYKLEIRKKLHDYRVGNNILLIDSKEKLKFWDLLFRDDRGKNAQTLAVLEIRPIERKTILEKLETRL
jgi:hypothetical protein